MSYGRKRLGRKAKSITFNGLTIEGLGSNPVKDKSGDVIYDRFYVIGSKPRTWLGRDVDQAVKRYRQLQGNVVDIPIDPFVLGHREDEWTPLKKGKIKQAIPEAADPFIP